MLIGYARVSTEDQSLDRQTDALLGAGCERVYCDKESGMRGRRAELDRMLDALREGDTVCVVSIDRLGRSVRQVLALVEDLRRMGVGITSLKEGFQADTDAGRFFLTVCAAFAEMEHSMTVSRTKDAPASARARGVVGGRPRVDRDALAMAVKMHGDGYTGKQIETATGISRSTMYRELRRVEEQASPASESIRK